MEPERRVKIKSECRTCGVVRLQPLDKTIVIDGIIYSVINNTMLFKNCEECRYNNRVKRMAKKMKQHPENEKILSAI